MARASKEYEVERIVKARVSYKRGRKILWQFLVKWKGYTDKANSWEPIESFENSPQLIEKFWKKVDTGGRDVYKASLFSLREELSPHDDTWSDVNAEGDDDEDQKGGDESASPKSGRKRPAKAADGAPKRKRGRPSKADKAKMTEEAKESEAQQTSDAVEGGDSASVGASGPEKKISTSPLTNAAASKRVIRIFSTMDSSDEDEDAPGIKVHASQMLRKSAMKKRKAYIESDEDEAADSVSDASSHAGSLFSGDDNSEQEQGVPAETIKTTTAAPERPRLAPLPAVASTVEQVQKPEESKKPKLALTRQGRPVPRVKMIDDPDIQRAVEMRVYGRSQGQGSYQTNAGTSSQTAPSAPSSNSVDQVKTRYKPTLLTFEKGKLTSHRSVVVPPSPWEPPTRTIFSASESLAAGSTPKEAASISPTSVLDSARDSAISDCESTDPEPKDSIAIDTSPDFAPSANIVGSLETDEDVVVIEKPPAGPPPTVEELLRLSGVDDAAEDLPDFSIDEMGPSGKSLQTVISGGSQYNADSAVVEETPVWKQPAVFRVPTPATILQKVVITSNDEPDPPAKPDKLVIPLRLGRTAIVPVILKDERKPIVGPKLSELLKPGELDGPLGKLFPRDAFNFDCVAKACSNARLLLDDDCSEEQRLLFSKFVDELGRDNLFFVEIGQRHYVLCSSENATAQRHLSMGVQNSGLRKAVIIQFAPVIDRILYERCAEKGRAIRLE